MVMLLLIALLGACSNSGIPSRGPDVVTDKMEQAYPGMRVVSEVRIDDFVLQIGSEKSSYEPGEPVKLEARLMYAGNKDEDKIYHAMTPLAFDISESTRQFNLGYAMEEPLIERVMKQQQWYVQPYKKGAGYSEQEGWDAFIKEFMQGDGFPEGNYSVKVIADFYTLVEGEKVPYRFDTEINLTVGKK